MIMPSAHHVCIILRQSDMVAAAWMQVASKMQQMEKNQQEHVEKLAAKVQGMQVRVLQDARKHEQQLLKKQHKLAGASPPERNKSGSSKGQ